MRMFQGSDDEEILEDDGPIFGSRERFEERKRKLELAKEIASGLVMGTFERDEEVWQIVKEIEDSKK